MKSNLSYKHQAPMGYLIHEVARLMKRRFEEEAKVHGITLPQWRVLAQIALNDGITQVGLATAADTDPMTISGVLDRLGPDGVLINIARGSLVDQDALIAALAEQRIAGAGLDVFAQEPNVPEALRTRDTVVLAPHQGSATGEGRAEMRDLVLANLDAHFAGRPLPTPLIRPVSHDARPGR